VQTLYFKALLQPEGDAVEAIPDLVVLIKMEEMEVQVVEPLMVEPLELVRLHRDMQAETTTQQEVITQAAVAVELQL
jgi:hypothetical protein